MSSRLSFAYGPFLPVSFLRVDITAASADASAVLVYCCLEKLQ